MAKTITLRIDDDTYTLFKRGAEGERRSISNFIEYAALSYLSNSLYVSDQEMNDILADKELVASFKKAERDIKEGKYRIA